MDAENNCNVCRQPFDEPVYVSPRECSLTTGGVVVPKRTIVHCCAGCTHTYTAPVMNLESYYDHDYNINLSSADDDDLYAIGPEGNVYRSEHQAVTLLEKVSLSPGANVLDYGCAKAASSRRIAGVRPDLKIHLFEVSENYNQFWPEIADSERCANYRLPPEWAGRMDAVYSFFVLEHVDDLAEILGDLRGVLKPGGQLYFIVPNVFRNLGDLLVIDHVNHFSKLSLQVALERNGFALQDIDEDSHRNAFVVRATKEDGVTAAPVEGEGVRCELRSIAEGWLKMQQSIVDFEAAHPGVGKGAIYGSGFYGSLVATTLGERERIGWFLDQNPHRQGQERFGIPIESPTREGLGIDHCYIGLNPATSAEEIAGIKNLLGDVGPIFVFDRDA